MTLHAFTIRDAVDSRNRQVTERFSCERLVAIAGVSMGRVQGDRWTVSYPEMRDSAAALKAVEC